MISPYIGNQKSYLLLSVVFAIIVVVLFAGLLMTIIMSQARITKHETGRIQAYYAALAGYNYAYDKLRLNDTNWSGVPPVIATITRRICRSGCVAPDINDPELPSVIRSITIQISPPGSGINNTRLIKVSTDYSLL